MLKFENIPDIIKHQENRYLLSVFDLLERVESFYISNPYLAHFFYFDILIKECHVPTEFTRLLSQIDSLSEIKIEIASQEILLRMLRAKISFKTNLPWKLMKKIDEVERIISSTLRRENDYASWLRRLVNYLQDYRQIMIEAKKERDRVVLKQLKSVDDDFTRMLLISIQQCCLQEYGEQRKFLDVTNKRLGCLNYPKKERMIKDALILLLFDWGFTYDQIQFCAKCGRERVANVRKRFKKVSEKTRCTLIEYLNNYLVENAEKKIKAKIEKERRKIYEYFIGLSKIHAKAFLELEKRRKASASLFEKVKERCMRKLGLIR